MQPNRLLYLAWDAALADVLSNRALPCLPIMIYPEHHAIPHAPSLSNRVGIADVLVSRDTMKYPVVQGAIA